MKNYLFNLAILLMIPFVVGINRSANLKSLKIGEKAPMSKHKMKSVSNEEVSLSTLKKEKGARFGLPFSSIVLAKQMGLGTTAPNK